MERKSSKNQAQQCLKIIKNWAHEVEEIEAQAFGDSIFESEKLWLLEVMSEVKNLVSGNPQGRSSMVKEEEEEDEEEIIPVLLPKTPKIHKKRPNMKRKSEDQENEEKVPKTRNRRIFYHDSSSGELPTDEEKEVPLSSLKSTTKKSKSLLEEEIVEICPETIASDEGVQSEEMSVDTPTKVHNKRSITLQLESIADDSNNKSKRSSTRREAAKSVPNKKESQETKITKTVSRKLRVEGKLHSTDEDSDNENNLKLHKLKKSLSSKSISLKTSPHLQSKRSISKSPLPSVSNSTFVIPLDPCNESKLSDDDEKEKPLRRRSSRLSGLSAQSDSQRDVKQSRSNKKSLTKEPTLQDSKENIVRESDHLQQNPRGSVRLIKQISTMDLLNFESPKLSSTKYHDSNERRSKRRSSLCQYKGLVNKAIKTSITAEQKRHNTHEEVKCPDLKTSTTPLRQTRKMFKAFSAASSSGMKASTMKRTNSATRYASPLPSKKTSTISSSSKVFLSIKSASKLFTRTGGCGPNNITKGPTSLLSFKSPKPSAKESRIKVEEEALRKRAKEDEVIRRREEIAKLRIEERKQQREARLKKVMENKKMLKKPLSSTDLRKQENTTKSNKNVEKILKNDIREREEREMERTRLKEIQIRQQQEEKVIEAARKRLEDQISSEKKSKAIQGTKLHTKETSSKTNHYKPQLNITITKNVEETTVNSYDMTPAPEDRSPEPLKDEDNYDIGDIKSDDDTDDEDRPRKAVPSWASGPALRQAIVQQISHPPDVDEIFDFPPMPNLELMFPFKKQRFFKRTSSAVWNHAPISHIHLLEKTYLTPSIYHSIYCNSRTLMIMLKSPLFSYYKGKKL